MNTIQIEIRRAEVRNKAIEEQKRIDELKKYDRQIAEAFKCRQLK